MRSSVFLVLLGIVSLGPISAEARTASVAAPGAIIRVDFAADVDPAASQDLSLIHI